MIKKFTVSKLQGLLQADWRQIFSAYIVNTGNSEVDRDPSQIFMIMSVMILIIVIIVIIVIILMILMIMNTRNTESEMDRDPAQIISLGN